MRCPICCLVIETDDKATQHFVTLRHSFHVCSSVCAERSKGSWPICVQCGTTMLPLDHLLNRGVCLQCVKYNLHIQPAKSQVKGETVRTSRNSTGLYQLVDALEEAHNAIMVLATIAETLENTRTCLACARLRVLPALEVWLAGNRDDLQTMNAVTTLDGSKSTACITTCDFCLEQSRRSVAIKR